MNHLNDAIPVMLHSKMNKTRMTCRVQVLHSASFVPALPLSHCSEVPEVLLGSLADCQDRGVLLLLFPGVLLYLFPFLEVELQSSENRSGCQHLNFSHWRSVDASAECTIQQQRSFPASSLPPDRTLGIHILGSTVGVAWLAYAVMHFVTGEDCQPKFGKA